MQKGTAISRARELPSLVGRVTAVMNAHQHLGRTLRRLEELCSGLEASCHGAESIEFVRMLGQLEDDLTRHFAMEEDESHFGTLTADRSALIGDILTLRDEHRSMLSRVQELRWLGERGERSALAHSTLEFLARLREHERREDALVYDYLLKD